MFAVRIEEDCILRTDFLSRVEFTDRNVGAFLSCLDPEGQQGLTWRSVTANFSQAFSLTAESALQAGWTPLRELRSVNFSGN